MHKKTSSSWQALAFAAIGVSSMAISGIASADQLTFFAYPSPSGIDWSTPHRLALTTVENEYEWTPYQNDHPIGHVNIDLDCKASESEPAARVVTGMTAIDGSEERQLILHENYGLGVLFHTFKGRLEGNQEVLDALPGRYQHGGIAYLRYQINPRTCRRLLRYVTEYRQRGYDHFYGLPNRPRYGEGAGCTAFGVSFLDLAGLLDPELTAAWSKTLRVPNEYIGGPLTGNSVGLLGLLIPFHDTRWAEAFEPGYDLFFWDPDTMFRWIRRKWRYLKTHPEQGLAIEARNKAHGVYLDRRDVPTPEDPIWKTD